METLVASTFNLVLLLAILFYKLRVPLRDFVEQRHHSIRSDIQTVQNQLRQAQEKYDEFSAKLNAINVEIDVLREQSKQDALAAHHRILSESHKMMGNVISDAKRAADGLYLELKTTLYAELSGKVLDRAEHLLRERLTGDDRVRMREEFSSQVERVQ